MFVKIREDLIVRKIEDEIFIYDRHRSYMHSFNSTGVFIWNMIEKEGGKDAVVKALVDEFDVDAASAENDFMVFYNELVQAGLVAE